MKKLTVFLGVACLMFGMVQTASAISVTSQLFLNELNLLSDNSAEYLLNADGTTKDSGDSLVQVGDRLVGGFNIGTVEQLLGTQSNVIGASGVNELTGIFDITVTSAVFNGSSWDFAFGATPAASSLFTLLGVAQPDGTMVALFEDSTVDYTRTGGGADDGGAVTENTLLLSAIGGNEYWTLGFTGPGGTAGASEGWIANVLSNDISIIGLVAPPGNGGTVNFALSLLADVNDTGPSLGAVSSSFGGTVIGANGSGNLLGTGGVNTPFDNFDNFDFVIAPIPEPGTFVLLGLGMLGLAGMARKRSK